ncbi:MAG: VOC family protein [Pseudomonadota bacterium]
MGVELAKDAIDLGIVTNNGDAMVEFYKGVLGFEEEPSTPFPMGGKMIRLLCGDSLIKIVIPDPGAPGAPPPGPIANATGLRYWTMRVNNLTEIMAACEASGAPITVPVTEVRPGVTIGIVEDPDGNQVEFVSLS